MQILILTMSDFGGRGGIAKYNSDLITAMSANDSVKSITVLPRCIDHPEDLHKRPEKVIHFSSAALGKCQYITTLFKLLLSRQKYDLVVCGHVNLSPLAFLIARWKRAKTCLLTYGVEVWQKPSRSWLRFFINKMHLITSISAFTQKKFETWSSKTIGFLLAPAVELSAFSAGEKDPTLMEQYGLKDKKILVSLGRLDAAERYKGFDEVLDVLPDLLVQIPDLIYVIAGDGNDRDRLTQKAEQLGIQNSVIFTGYISEMSKLALYRSADVFIMPGRGEGFGIVYLEARACGLPAIGSVLDASREALLEGELGQLVNPDSPDEIKMAILNALKTPDRTVPAGLDYFSMQRFTERAHQLLEQINHA